MPPKRKHAATEANGQDAKSSKVHAKTASQDSLNDAAIEARLKILKAPVLNKDGELVDGSMDEPPKAGNVDPVGYKTNPPPTDRPVRVYADGVFDLFHLGCVQFLLSRQVPLADPLP